LINEDFCSRSRHAKKNNHRCPAGNALGVHMFDIPRIIF
jgi:hypothetical protein